MLSPVYFSLLTLLISAATVNSQTSKECDTGIYLINTAVDCGIFGTSDMHHHDFGCGGTQATHTWPGTALTVAATAAATTQVTRSVVASSAIPARTGTSSAFSAAPAAAAVATALLAATAALLL
ncbi:hypothetical protein BDR26DRAFT_981594 [Obelidium mucronatum]|nr:hypothetical protein BDR26DRAFT_981594 [Obelidium mucronatum]